MKYRKHNAGQTSSIVGQKAQKKELRSQVLRSVMALGVAVTTCTWMGMTEAWAEGNITRVNDPKTNLMQNQKADIFAESASGSVGLNRFQDFNVASNELANLYFKTANDSKTLDTLVNTVENRIDIQGTVNAIRDNHVGGNLYFLSPKGMVVGAGGVINAGSLTAITTNTLPETVGEAEKAVTSIQEGTYPVSSSLKDSIEVHGSIHTATGIDLRAAYISIAKEANAGKGPLLQTGMVFQTTVNTDGLIDSAKVVEGERLKASFSKDGNIIIADPNAADNKNLQGDGSIRIQAQADSRNTATEFLGITAVNNTVEAKAMIGEGATIDAIGNVDIGAEATVSNSTNIQHLWDFVGFSKATTEVQGTISGADVNIHSDATSNLSYKSLGNPLDLVNEGTKQAGYDVSGKLTDAIWKKLEKGGMLSGKAEIVRNVMQQLYMPFNITDAKATTTIGELASISSHIRGQVKDEKGNIQDVGGHLDVTAHSVSDNAMKIKLQPYLKKGDVDVSKYFTGGFIYEDSDSQAIVNVNGSLTSEKNVNVNAEAENSTEAVLGVKHPMFSKSNGKSNDAEYASSMFTAAVGVISQETVSQVNIGKQATIEAKEDLAINASSDNGISTEIDVLNKDDTALSTSISVANSDGTAEVNQEGQLTGGNVEINAAHTMSDFSLSTSNDYEGEWTGVDAIFDSDIFKGKVDNMQALSKLFRLQSQQAAGNNVQNPQAKGEPAWNQYFDIGASISIANVNNTAKVNLRPTSYITSTGDVSIDAGVTIEDTNIVTSNILASQEEDVKYGASAAVAVENMHNTAEVNVESNGRTAIESDGNLSIHAGTEQRYTRVDNMVDDLKKGWKDFLNNWSEWSTQKDWNKKFQRLQNGVADIMLLVENDKATSAKDSKLFHKKAQAMYDLAKQLTGTSKLADALEAFLDASNYANMYVAASARGESDTDATAMAAGNVGIQNLHNTANVNIHANTKLIAGDTVDVKADVVESNVLFAGKMALIPDISPVKGTSYGLGGSVGVQNAYSNSKVQINQGVDIEAGEINVGTDNDVLNLGINFGGSKTSALGITGMVNYLGGTSKAETLVDDDVHFTATKKVEHVKKEKKKDTDKDEYEDKVTASGAINITAHNNANVISLAGNFVGGDYSSVGVSTGVISYDVQTLAKVENLDKQADGSSSETEQTKDKKGTLSANAVEVSAVTDGTINNLTVAGTSSKKSKNPNEDGGGVDVSVDSGRASQASGGLQNVQLDAGNEEEEADPILKVNAAGSVSWNYVNDKTEAKLDNVEIKLTAPDIREGVIDQKLIQDKSASVHVNSKDNSYIGAYSGSAALTKFGEDNTSQFTGSLSGAIAVNDLKKSTLASMGNTTISQKDVAADILNYAHNKGAQVATGLSLGVETGKRADGISVNLGASGSANYVDSTVQAAMGGNGISGGNTNIHNVAYDQDIQVAGGVTAQYTQSTASVGAAVSINKVKNTIQAAMKNNTIGTSSSYVQEVHNIAASHLTQVGSAISVGVSKGDKSYAVGNVAVNSNQITNDVEATVDGDTVYAGKVSVEARDGKLSVDEAENPYMEILNSVPSSITVGDDGTYYDKEGHALDTAFAVDKNGQKEYRKYTLRDDGFYYDEQGNKLNFSWDETAQKPVYTDKDGHAVDVMDIQYLDAKGNPVDVLADEKRTLFDLDGSDAMAQANGKNGSDFSATVTEGKDKADYTSSEITLKNQGNTIVGTALGLGVKTGDSGQVSGAGAAAASISHVKNTFKTTVKNASMTTGTSESDDSALQVIASSDTRMVGVAAGVAAETSGSQQIRLGLAGSGVKQTITNQTTAAVEDSNLTTDHLLVNGTTSSSLVSVAGQVSVTTSQQGVAGGLTWAENKMNNTTGAYARGLTLSGIDGKETSLDVLADNQANTWAAAAGTSVSLGYGTAEGAYASNHGTNNTEAMVEKSVKKKNTMTNGKSIVVKASDTSSEKAVAGSVAVAAGQNAMATLGGAVSYNNIGNSAKDKQHVTAKLSDTTITTVEAGKVDVLAENKTNLLNLALGGAVRAGSGSMGVSGQGSVAATTLYSDTYAGMSDVTISNQEQGKQKANVTVKADSQSQVTNSADALAISAGTEAQVAFGGAVSTIKSDADTRTELTKSHLMVDDLTAQAISTNRILNIGIGLSVGASGMSVGGSLAGNVASNQIANGTTVSVDGATVVAEDTMAVLADSQESLQNYGGAISVGGSGGGGGVAVGTTIVTNTISGNTEANVSNSNITALGKGDGISVFEETVDHTNHSVNHNQATKKGLVVHANAVHTLKDLSVTAGVGASATAGIAADATVVINAIGGKTGSAVTNTQINTDKKQAELANADVSVTAYDKADINSHLGNVAVGAATEMGIGAAGAGDRNTVSRETVAQIVGNQNTKNTLHAHDVAVNALGETKIHVSESGVAAGGSATGAAAAVGSVSSDRFTSQTSALISGVQGTIHSLAVKANRLADIATYNNAISVSGAIGSASVSVGVTNIEDASQTRANVSQVALTADGNQDNQVKVKAQNDIQISTELSGDALAVSLGGAAGISVANVNIEGQTEATVDQSTLGQKEQKFGTVQVVAENDISHRYQNIAAGISSLLGTAVGKGAVTVNTGTRATISNSQLYGGNIIVGADEKRNIQASMVGLGAGAANVGVNVMYTNVGTSLKDGYTYDRNGEGENASYDTQELQSYVNEALSRMNQQAEKAKTYDHSIEKGSTTINKGDASKAGLTTAVSNSTLTANDKLDIHAKATTNTDISIHQTGIGIANVAVAANRMDVENKLNVSISNAKLSGNEVQIQSTTDGKLKSYTGQGGFSGVTYADTTGYVKHGGTNSISIDDSTIMSTGHPLWVRALNEAKIDNSSMNINLSSVNAGRMVLDSEDSSEVAVRLGEKGQKKNTFTASSIDIEAQNAPGVKSENKADVTPISSLKAKGVITTARATGKATLNVTDRNHFDTDKEEGLVMLSALTGGQGNKYFTTEAISHTVGVGGIDIAVNKSRTYNGMEASATLGAASFAHEEKEIIDGKETTQTTYADVSVGASNDTTSHSYIHSVDAGGAISGNNFAQNYSYSKATTTIDTGKDTLHVKNLDAYASNSDTVEARADGTSAGMVAISPFLAKVENTVDAKTTMNVKGNILSDEDTYLFALRNDDYNLLANGLTVTVAGGGAAGAYNHITNDTVMNLDNALIGSVGDLLVDAENTTTLNRKKGFEKMVMGTGWDAVGVDTSRIDNTILSNAHVNLDQSLLLSNGSADVISHTDEDLLVNGYVYNVSVGGGAEARVNNSLTNDDRITLRDSKIKTLKSGKDITLSAADDVKLFTYANAETATGILTGANALMKNQLTRNNSIDMSQGTNSLYSSQDIHLYAGKHADGSVSLLDLDAQATDFIGGAIPVFPRPSVSNTISQNNQITIGKDSASRSVRHSDFYAASGREMANVSANRYVGIYGSSQKGAFVSNDKGETIQGKTANNFVQVDGSAVAGVANKIEIVIGKAGDVVVRNKDLRDTVVGGAKDSSDISVSVKADESTGLTKDSILFGTEDYTSTLFKRYQEIEDLMLEYGKDNTDKEKSAAYMGYKAEAERIEQEMLSLGLAAKDKDGKIIPKASLAVDYVEIPELTSSGGNITVDTDDLIGSGTMKAQGSPEITITNNTNLMTKIDGITVDDPGGKLLFNGNNLTGKTTADFNKSISVLNKGKNASFGTVEAADGQSGKITITGNYNGNPLNYKGDILDDKGQKVGEVSGSMKPMANILIQGNVYSKDGEVTIRSKSDSIVIQGKGIKDAVAISGAKVNIDASSGNITQGYTDGIVNIGGDVKKLYDDVYQKIIKSGKTDKVDQIKTDIKDGSQASGSYIAGGHVYINASDINVNGVIQSGFSDYYADISDDSTKEAIDRINMSYDGQRELSDAAVTTGDKYKIIEGGAFWDAHAGCYKYRLNVYYNPSSKKVLVENIDASGGQIYLTGRISSTGNGQIICLDGVSDISLKNSTGYDLKVGQLTTNDVHGLVRIQDTAKKTLTEITNGKTVVKTIDDQGRISDTGTESSFDKTKGFDYNPQQGLKYTWTSGKETTEYTKYKNDFKTGGWDLKWSSDEAKTELAKWMKEHPEIQGETGSDKEAPRKEGETIRLDTTTSDSQVTVSHKENSEKNMTIDGTRKWSSGLWGYYKHSEVTWTESTGSRDTYDASIKADNPIHVKFIGKAAEDGKISVDSTSNVELTGNIGNTKLYETKNSDGTMASRMEKGTVEITSRNGSLVQSGGSLYGSDISLGARKDMENIQIIAGDTVHVSAVHHATGANMPEQNSIDLTVNGAYQAKGNMVLGHIGSVVKNGNEDVSLPNDTGITGLVDIKTTGKEGTISQDEDGSIVSDRINLTSEHGAIYGQKKDDGTYTALKVYAGQQPIGLDTLDASINAKAKGNISLEQTAGDMRIGQIISTDGDVSLTVAKGSVVDALPYVSNDRGDADDLLERWRAIGLIDGNDEMKEAKNKLNHYVDEKNKKTDLGDYKEWDANALLYAIQDSVVNQTSENLPKTSTKDPNVIGHNITITVADSVGLNSGNQKKIDMTTLLEKDSAGNYLHLDDLKALSKADASMVTWENDGKTAIITEKLPIGVQQTTKTKVNKDGTTTILHGSLTLKSAATAAGNGNTGNIFIEGRDHKDNDITQATKDLHLGEVATKVGDITISSLGGIYQNDTKTYITGRNLYLTAANGNIGMKDQYLKTKLFGTDLEKDGLSAVASGGIYIDQTGNNNLILRSISSGGDIYLGSDASMVMGEVNGTEAVNYIRAENNGSITLEARGGSLGEAETDTDGKLSRKSNKGIRILNAADENGSKVTLKAKDNVFVTGVASHDGKTATKDGAAGVLNLTVGATSQGKLQNIGIAVDGALHLTGDAISSETASIYTSSDLQNENTISSTDTYLGSAKNLYVSGKGNTKLIGTDKLTLEAGQDVEIEEEDLASKNLLVTAGQDMRLENVGITADTAHLTAQKDISYRNMIKDLTVSSGTTMEAQNILLSAEQNHSLTTSGTLTAKEKATLQGEQGVTQSGGTIQAETVTLSSSNDSVNQTAGSVQAKNTMAKAGKDISLASKTNKLQNVSVDAQHGSATIVNANDKAGDLNVSTIGAVAKDLTITNLKSGIANEIHFNKNLKAGGNITITNEEADIEVANGTTMDAQNISLIAKNNDVKFTGGTVTAKDAVNAEAQNANVAGGTISAKKVRAEADKLAISKGTINAATVEATNDLVMTGGVIHNDDLTIKSTHDIQQTGGLISANKVTLDAGNEINQTAGSVISKDVFAKAGTDANLASTTNKLQNVTVDAKNGSATIVSANDEDGDLNVTTVGTVKDNLTITNLDNGIANKIHFDKNLQAGGTISITNEEANIEVADGTMEATNISLTATNDNVKFAGGKVTTKEKLAAEAKKNVSITGGELTGGSVDLKAGQDVIHNGGTIITMKDALLDAGRNVLLQSGILKAENAAGTVTMNAKGYVSEDSTGYQLADVGTLSVSAGAKNVATGRGIDLGSKTNKLAAVKLAADDGDVILGNGGDTTLDVSVKNGTHVNGKIDIHNYEVGMSNDVIIHDSLRTTGDITIYNDEKDISVEKKEEGTKSVLLQGRDILVASAGSITNANGVEASGNVSFLSGKAMTNTGEVHANGNVILMTQEDTDDYNDIINTGDIYAGGDITITSADSVINWGHFQSNKKGNITMSAGDDVLNLGIMEAVDGNVELTSSDGSIYNQLGADLISGHGNVTLHAKSQNANLYYYNEEGELLKAPVGTEVHTYTEGAKKGGQYITIEGKEYDAVRDGSVFNAGDALAMGGTISFISDAGDVTNYDDFDTLVDKEGQTYSRQYNGKDIATGNVTISAEKGSLYNAKDIEAGGSISLIAKEGLQNLAYNLYAGQDITLHATSGDILNTSVLESLYGDVTLVADNGNVINGKKGTPSSGDIITLGGTVHLEAKGKDKAGNGHNVTNYGDIVAIGKTNGDKADSGSIILSSEFGDVNNYDDLSRLDDGSESYKYDKQKHISVKDLPSDVSYNVATNNIEMSAAHGKLYNDKQYLVALKDVVLTAKEGLGSYGDVILAGGNISMTDTDGDLINRANLVSMDGDISLKAEKGSVINGTKGKLVALNGNVSLEAGGDIEQNYQIYLVDEKGKQQTWTPAKDVGDRILISESYYKDEEGNKHFLSNTAPFAPEGKSVYTQISYIDDGGNRQLLQDGLVGQLEAFRKGDVVNRGDMVSIRGDNKSKAEAGNVQLKSTHGNVTNYDDFKLVDGKTDDKGQGYYDFLGSTGVAGEAGAKFNTGTAYTENKRYILSDSGIAMEAPEGYLYNDLALISHEDIFLESGKDLTIGTNFASVESDGNIAIRSNKGSVKNNSSVVSKMGNIILDGYAGVTSGTRDSLKADHGSISVVSEAGDIQMKELVAGKMAVAGTKKGNVDIRTIQGDDVILYTEDETSDISIKDNLTVKDHLVLQGNSFTLPKISRKDTSGTLLVDVNGIGGATKGYLNLDLDGDVRFTTLNVTKADVTTGGKLGIDALHVEDNAHFEAMGFTTGVYGKAPHHDSSHALYFDIGHGQGGSRGYTLKADDFYVIKENTPEGIRAIRSLRELHDWLDQAGKGAETFGKDNGDWMNLYIDGPHGQRSNGLLLHIDTYFHSLNQRWSAEDLASKLLDFKPYMGYMAHYDVPMTVYDRYNVIENDE